MSSPRRPILLKFGKLWNGIGSRVFDEGKAISRFCDSLARTGDGYGRASPKRYSKSRTRSIAYLADPAGHGAGRHRAHHRRVHRLANAFDAHGRLRTASAMGDH